jgi:hypothetical protein
MKNRPGKTLRRAVSVLRDAASVLLVGWACGLAPGAALTWQPSELGELNEHRTELDGSVHTRTTLALMRRSTRRGEFSLPPSRAEILTAGDAAVRTLIAANSRPVPPDASRVCPLRR